MFLFLLVVLSIALCGVYLPAQTLFSNDGPLCRLLSQCHQMPGRFTGCWEDLNGLGFSGGPAPPGISFGLQLLLKPIGFSKFYALISLLILGLGAWCFFFSLRLAPVACYLGGLAAALNSNFFSVATWGVAAQTINAGMFFFALAALADTTSPWRWPRVVLAGLAVGMGVIEGADVGAIYSLYIATYILFQSWTGEGLRWQRITRGLSRLALVTLCAAWIAAPAITSLVGSDIKGIVGTEQDAQTKESRWDWSTQWSLPVQETWALVIPGLFGYRMDTPDGGQYWGEIGRAPAIDRFIKNGEQGTQPKGLLRQTGGGFYSGVLVVILAIWSLVQALPKTNSIFTARQRQWIWFWLVVALVSLLIAFGRFAPFYQWLYALPYVSTIRNPVKFISLVCFAIIILFAYGLDGLWRAFMQPDGSAAPLRWAGFKVWWSKARQAEKSWIRGCALVLVLSLLGWLGYASRHQPLVDYLETVGFSDWRAEQIASFSLRQVGWFVLFFVFSAGLIACIVSGAFAGARARWGAIVLGLLLVADLSRVNQKWVVYWNYPDKYASNPIVDLLRDRPFEHRVALLPGQPHLSAVSLDKFYNIAWLQQLFPFYNVQSLDIVQMSRKPRDYAAYLNTFSTSSGQSGMTLTSFLRFLMLTNSRFLLGDAASLPFLNEQISRVDQQFRIVDRFDLVGKPGITNLTTTDDLRTAQDQNGRYALFEFAGALPRAKLYPNWQIETNDQAILAQLVNPAFAPDQTVLVSGGIQPAAANSDPNQKAGTVAFASYSPKDIVLNCDAASPSVLLLNDRFDPDWKVLVDGKANPMLHCNYIMRGVFLTAGQHTVEFRFVQDYGLLYVSLAAMAVSVIILVAIFASSCLTSIIKSAQPGEPA